MTGNEARQLFLDYFKKHNHKIVKSSSLVPGDDPTLLFTNAGMVQFKRTFLGEEKRDYVCATTSQKCVRAGGKHNDLENVGYTARHHTFFEMLGNFSFGDYFKKKAIEFAWDLLTNGYKLPEDKLWVSVYLDDNQAYDLWHKNIGVPEDRIVRFGEKDNFWSMGDTGPCGPCSEIHIDRGEEAGCKGPNCKLGCECDRYLEIWNLVFMQFNRDETGKMTPLPRPSIDTGMGLERIVSVVQNAPTNYETDFFTPIFKTIEDISEKRIGESSSTDVAMKVIADHSRAAAFLIGDGVLPSNEGRGYVLRRIMRRAIRYGRNLDLNKPFLHKTAEIVFKIMKPAYPELIENKAYITNIILNEEKRFSETLDYGLKILNDTLEELQTKKVNEIPGDIIFKLYDTYGFPVDIVQDIVRDQGIKLDMAGFQRSMAKQREQSRSVASFSKISAAYKNLSSRGIRPEFTGYDETECESKILLIVKENKEINEAVSGDQIEIITAKTPFYGEGGGQAGDSGRITGENFEIKVENTVKDPTGLIVHKGKVVKGKINKNQSVKLTINTIKRKATATNHTATHILHAVLRSVLGDHVKQAGSMVASDRLRFDFTHFSQVDTDTLNKIELLVNEQICWNIELHTKEMDSEQAFKSGAMALFEEKYGDSVRVVSIGDFSKELCGGTHTNRTGDIGLFRIINESSVAAGVRRIEAVTGSAALEYSQQISKNIQNLAYIMKEKPEKLSQKLEKILSRQKALEKEVTELKNKIASLSSEASEDDIREINGISVLSKKVEIDSPVALRDMADKFKDKLKSGVVVLGSEVKGKVLLIAGVTKDLVKTYHAGSIVKQTAAIVGGGGGGRPDMAQAGGSKPEKLNEALEKVYEIVQKNS
ncbi:alanine--tRNA ligase/DNA-binding transcriptional repressor [Candidatus Magnetomoraceae bacterium gMMP-15]